jgi:hypothetical protein
MEKGGRFMEISLMILQKVRTKMTWKTLVIVIRMRMIVDIIEITKHKNQMLLFLLKKKKDYKYFGNLLPREILKCSRPI